MKKSLLFLFLAALCARPLLAAEDCPKNLDACAGGKKLSSPFVEASLREKAPEPKAPPAQPKPAPAPAAAAPSEAKPAAPAAEPQPALPAAPAPLASPLWLLFVGGVLGGLYLYLASGRRKGRKK